MQDDKKNVLRLQGTVVRRVVPMTSAGCDNLRAIRNHYHQQVLDNTGVEASIPYPTAIHMALSEFCEMKGIKVEPENKD